MFLNLSPLSPAPSFTLKFLYLCSISGCLSLLPPPRPLPPALFFPLYFFRLFFSFFFLSFFFLFLLHLLILFFHRRSFFFHSTSPLVTAVVFRCVPVTRHGRRCAAPLVQKERGEAIGARLQGRIHRTASVGRAAKRRLMSMPAFLMRRCAAPLVKK